MSLTKVSYSMINGSPVNAFDFLTPAEQAQVVARNQTANAPDVTAGLQAAIDATPKGGQLRIPNGFYRHTGLSVVKGIEIVGDTPPDFWDNDSVVTLNGGTVLWNSSTSSNNLTIEPPDAGDRRMRFHIQDVLLIGAIWTGSDFGGSPTSGHGFYINGRDAQAETQIICSWERIGACYHAEHGVLLTGSVYGCDMGMVSCFYNGKNNFRIQNTSEPIGEMTISHIRCFGGGSLASNDLDKSCVYMVSSGLINIGFITATYPVTYAVLLGGGRWNIGSIQTESLGGTIDSSRIIIQFGDGITNPSASEIGIITCAPQTNYPGTMVKFKNGTRGNNIQQVLCDVTGATGDVIVFETNTELNSIKRLFASTTGDEVLDNGNYNTYNQIFSIPSGFAKTGLWSTQNIGIGKDNIAGVATGLIGHAFFADGTANFSISDSGAGNVAYLECNNNAAVPDGYKFHSFRIGAAPVEIGKIEVASTGTAINYATSSDHRLKENISPMTGALEKLSMLKPVTYTWKRTGTQGQGFIAHELQEVFPDAVTGEKDGMVVEKIYEKDPTDLTGKKLIEKEVVVPNYQGVDTSHLVATLVAAVMELKAEINLLKS